MPDHRILGCTLDAGIVDRVVPVIKFLHSSDCEFLYGYIIQYTNDVTREISRLYILFIFTDFAFTSRVCVYKLGFSVLCLFECVQLFWSSTCITLAGVNMKVK